MGKKIDLVVADDGSGADGAVIAFNSLILQDHVNVIITMETSAARNAGLPVVARGKTPFIYTSYYEGRSCSPYLYVDAWVPDQQVASIVDAWLPSWITTGSPAILSRSRSLILRASFAPVCGNRMANSSPPYRPVRS